MTGIAHDKAETFLFWDLFKPPFAEQSVQWRATMDVAAHAGEFLIHDLELIPDPAAGVFSARFRLVS